MFVARISRRVSRFIKFTLLNWHTSWLIAMMECYNPRKAYPVTRAWLISINGKVPQSNDTYRLAVVAIICCELARRKVSNDIAKRAERVFTQWLPSQTDNIDHRGYHFNLDFVGFSLTQDFDDEEQCLRRHYETCSLARKIYHQWANTSEPGKDFSVTRYN